MLQFDIYNMNGEKVDVLSIDEATFGGTVNKAVLREAVLMYQANRRAGTASAKNRSEVTGTRKKPFRQKGTGRARQGSWIAPHHRGGGVPHGPHPRDYSYAIPKKARQAALKSAFLDKLQSATRVVDQIELEQPKTRAIADMLAALDVNGSCLIATLGASDSVVKSVRNLPKVTIKRMSDINAWDLLRPKQFVVTRAALESVVERFSNEDNKDGKV
jgi:large subunit ribosomal protein L4